MRNASTCLLTAILITAAFSIHGRAQSEPPLTNDQIVQMIQANMPSQLIIKAIKTGNSSKLDASPAALIALKKAGATDEVLDVVLELARARGGSAGANPTLNAPEKSDVLLDSKDPAVILRSFRTMFVNAATAQFFGTQQMKAALGANAGFRALGISIVEDRALADVVLDVSYTFAWDYPFVLKHQNTSVVLLSGKGEGAFSGPAGAASVADRLTKLLKPYRVPAAKQSSD